MEDKSLRYVSYGIILVIGVWIFSGVIRTKLDVFASTTLSEGLTEVTQTEFINNLRANHIESIRKEGNNCFVTAGGHNSLLPGAIFSQFRNLKISIGERVKVNAEVIEDGSSDPRIYVNNYRNGLQRILDTFTLRSRNQLLVSTAQGRGGTTAAGSAPLTYPCVGQSPIPPSYELSVNLSDSLPERLKAYIARLQDHNIQSISCSTWYSRNDCDGTYKCYVQLAKQKTQILESRDGFYIPFSDRNASVNISPHFSHAQGSNGQDTTDFRQWFEAELALLIQLVDQNQNKNQQYGGNR